MASSPVSRWEMLNHAMLHYQQYISLKNHVYSISFVDLLFISNFKGGNASITEPIDTLESKIIEYEKILEKISETFDKKPLEKLKPRELQVLIKFCDEFLMLTIDSKSKIRGFGASYASALLAAYFTNLIPILDRRILNGANICVEYDSQKQVKNIAQYYGVLIEKCHEELNIQTDLSLRELDKKWFIKSL